MTKIFAILRFFYCMISLPNRRFLAYMRKKNFSWKVQLRYKHPVAVFQIVKILYCIVLYIQILYLKRNRNCVSSCREFDVIGVKSKGRGSKTCERFVTHNSQLVNDLEYGDDMHANYFSRHSTSPNHRACIPLLDSRRLRSRECRGVTVRSIQLRW